MKYKLTDTAAKNAKPKPDGKQKKYTDGGGLYLLAMKSGKYWRYDYTHPDSGKRKTLALGVYPDITLKAARERHTEAREVLARGVDPLSYKHQTKAMRKAESENSFELIAREWFIRFSPTWVESHASKIIRRLERDVFPWIGSAPIAELEPPDILKVLRRIEDRGALETAHRVKQNIGQVFRYAVTEGKATRDQTADLKGALPPPKKQHFAAITDPVEVGHLLRAMDDYKGTLETRIALQMSAYLFTRPGELRQMEWAEINIEQAVWNISADKMKSRQPHLVPLSRQAVALLDEIRPLSGHRRYVFTSATDPRKPMSNNTVRQALRRLGYDNATMTAHGFRAMARTILDEELGIQEKYIEHQLAHAVKDANGTAYNRTKHLPQRIDMMQKWADYLDSLKEGATVIPLKRTG